MEINREEEWKVEEVLDTKIRYRKFQYLIEWTGYDIPDWGNAKDVSGLQASDVFHQKYTHKPGPLPDDMDDEHDW